MLLVDLKNVWLRQTDWITTASKLIYNFFFLLLSVTKFIPSLLFGIIVAQTRQIVTKEIFRKRKHIFGCEVNFNLSGTLLKFLLTPKSIYAHIRHLLNGNTHFHHKWCPGMKKKKNADTKHVTELISNYLQLNLCILHAYTKSVRLFAPYIYCYCFYLWINISANVIGLNLCMRLNKITWHNKYNKCAVSIAIIKLFFNWNRKKI